MALTFGDVSLVTPLGVFTIVANIFFASWFHGERLFVQDGIYTGIIMCGSVLTTVFAPHQVCVREQRRKDTLTSSAYALCLAPV